MITKDRKRTIPFLKLKVNKKQPEQKKIEKKVERNAKEKYWKLVKGNKNNLETERKQES